MWVQQTKKHWKRTQAIMRIVAAKCRGAEEDTLKTLVRTFLASQVMYGFNYHRFTKSQKEALGRLNRALMRIVTGLSKIVSNENLSKQAQMNTLENLAEEQGKCQVT